MATSLINTECKRYGCMKNLLACYANCRYSSRCDDLRNEIFPKPEQAASDINSYRRERELSAIEIQFLKRGVKFVDVASLQKNLAKVKKSVSKSLRKKKKRVKPVALTPRSEEAEVRAPKSKPVKSTLRATAKTTAATRLAKTQAVAPKRIATAVIRKTTEAAKESIVTAPQKKLALVPTKPRRTLKKKAKATAKKSRYQLETHLKMVKKIKDSETDNTTANFDANQSNAASAAEKSTGARRKKSGTQDASNKKKKRMFIILDGERSALVDEKGLMAKLLAGVSPNARYFEASEIELRLQIAHKK